MANCLIPYPLVFSASSLSCAAVCLCLLIQQILLEIKIPAATTVMNTITSAIQNGLVSAFVLGLLPHVGGSVPCDPRPYGDAVLSSSCDCTISTRNILYIAWRFSFWILFTALRSRAFCSSSSLSASPTGA